MADISDSNEYQKAENRVNEIVEFDNVPDGRDLLLGLEDKLKKSNLLAVDKMLGEKYERLVALLKFVVFPTLSPGDAKELLNKFLLLAIRKGINLIEKLDSFFLLYKESIDGLYHKEFIRAISENIEKIPANQNGLSISEWLREFNRFFSSDRKISHLEELEFVNNNQKAKLLKKEDRDLLLKVLRFYDYLRFPQQAKVVKTGHSVSTVRLPGAEDAGNKLKDPIENLKKLYRQYMLRSDSILEEEDRIIARTRGDIEQLKKELSVASRSGDKNRAIACLKILAGQKILPEAFKNSPAWQEAVRDYLVMKYGKSADPEAVQEVAGNLRYNASSPEIISEFLQYLLKEKLGMNENESALVGVEIGQLLGGQFQSLAYGNEETSSFQWAKNEIRNGRLISEIG